MPAYKRQHYLPCVYLQQFSEDGANSVRTSKIWRTDLKRQVAVPVESQCAEAYFYSKGQAASVETQFGELERLYGSLTPTIWSESNPKSEREYWTLLLMMLDLHIRNVAYANQSADENHEAYRVRLTGLRNQVLFGKRSTAATDAELLELFRTHWKVQLLQAGNGRQFITTDHPSLWFSMKDTSEDEPFLHLVAMPVTPYAYAVAMDTRVCDLAAGHLNRRDEETLTTCQIFRCWKAVYSSMQQTPEETDFVRDLLRARNPTYGFVDQNKQWEVTGTRLARNECFNFLKIA